MGSQNERNNAMKRTVAAVVGTLAVSLLATSVQAQAPGRGGRGRGSPDRPRQQQGEGNTLEQAVSDRAQLMTISFDGLAFLSGNLGSCTFLPPGKVSDYFGFQYMRDIDADHKGHNTEFLTRIAFNMQQVLNAEQKEQLTALAKEQVEPIQDLARRRFPLIKAFHRLLEGDLPKGSKGLDRSAVKSLSADNFEQEGVLAYRRAEVTGGVLRNLTSEQRAALAKLKFGDSRTWPEVSTEPIDKRGMSHDAHVAVMTYASEMFSWYAGSLEADVYFCPERHGTYFGSFYMKDAPAMGKRNYSISTSLTGDSGERFLATLTPQQRQLIVMLVELQRKDLHEIVQVRRGICVGLRRFLSSPSANKNTVLALSRRYGELDGEMSYLYATHFAEVNKTLSKAQRDALAKLRNLDDYPCTGAYVYSTPIPMPDFSDTDFLFTATKKRPANRERGGAKP